MATFHIHQDEKENPIHHPNTFGGNIGKHNQQQHHHKNEELKEKRPTLAVLNNIVGGNHRSQQQGKTVFGKLENQNKILTNQNEKQVLMSHYNQQQQNQHKVQQKKIIKSTVNTKNILTEQQQQQNNITTKSSFVVYEDCGSHKNETVICTNSNVVTDTATLIINNNISPVADSENVSDKNKIENVKKDNSKISEIQKRDPLKEVNSNNGLIETPMSVSEISSPMSVDKSMNSVDIENFPPNATSLPLKIKESDSIFELSEYQPDILNYFRELEKKYRPKPFYMKKQPDINNSMRTILVDWLVEVSEEYKLHNETLYLAVSYIDRFLSYMSVVRAKLQLVGTAAMFIASKYEEIYPPDVSEFVFITDDTYTKSQVLRMEQIILKILSFDLNVPSTYSFMNMYSMMANISDEVKFLAIYLSELTLLEGEPYLQYLPSQISSASLALSRFLNDLPMWNSELEDITQYSLDDLKEIILHISNSHNLSLTSQQQAIQEKYKANKYLQVATIKPEILSEVQLDFIIQNYNNTFEKKKK